MVRWPAILHRRAPRICLMLLAPAVGAAFIMLSGCPGNQGGGPLAANAGADQTVDAGAVVTLDGSGSSGASSFSWRQALGTPVILSSTTDPVVTFTAPDANANLTFDLTVSDGQNQSTARTIIGVRVAETAGLVEERMQRSVTDDPNVLGNFPNDWVIPGAGAGLPEAPADDLEFAEFQEKFENTRVPEIVQEDLAPGATRTVTLQLAGPAGLAGQVQWIGTTDPLAVTIALDGATLVTGTAWQMGHDRGGSYVNTQAAAAGLASISITNTSNVTVIVKIIFGATAL